MTTAQMTSGEPATGPHFDTKVVVVLNHDLAPWQELNVTAFLMSGIATSAPGLVGEVYRDGDDTEYLPMLRQPVMVMTGDSALLAKARGKASTRDDVSLAVYTRDLFTTSHDEANRAAVAAVAAADLDLVGIALRGPRNAVDRIVKGAGFHD
ncbi:hypothetical protein FB381_3684 [Nocardioides albertanoniae]|uniref:DUF2000 family protein n=1 Tax=Nocardioides albertanoniae TaxID=1175486 RepID=A0A543AAY9_9ACTN|nr:DUF2000 domain-containing protein [Nocardioides albertanoniae]TQL69768.1 hypothetical protein FB381_3684 [Nocardioides albertanoniae]